MNSVFYSPGVIDSFTGEHSFLSNFYPCEIVVARQDYPSVEHAYQAAKTEDPWHKARIQQAPTPNQAKRFGQRAPLRSDWEEIKLLVMNALVMQKFSDPELGEKLLATGHAELIEGNWWGDTYWGVCNGKGQNRLGKLLMDVRTVIESKS